MMKLLGKFRREYVVTAEAVANRKTSGRKIRKSEILPFFGTYEAFFKGEAIEQAVRELQKNGYTVLLGSENAVLRSYW